MIRPVRSLFLIALSACALLLGSSLTAHAQRQSVIKLNPLSLGFNNISLFYEHALMPQLSAQIGLNYMYDLEVFKSTMTTGSYQEVQTETIRGFGITPELRYYPGDETAAPKGFFLGVYTRFNPRKGTVRLERTGFADSSYRYNVTNTQVGLLVGYQTFVMNRLSFDFFIGPNYRFTQTDRPDTGDLSSFISDIMLSAQNGVGLRFGITVGVALGPEMEP